MLLVGTGNQHKLEEISAILADLPLRVVGQDHLPPGEDVEETGTTFAENAEIKALAFAARAAALPAEERPRWVVADDSGLCVDALDGAPGVLSARYAGPGCSYADNNTKLLHELADVPTESRGARFVCSICCAAVPASPDAAAEVLFRSEGVCPGTIAFEKSGSGGFGYDPLFVETSTGCTFADLPSESKNEISHRGRALREFHTSLLTFVDG
jgi:XTP/dITP diphosphohydrolase